MKIHRNAPNNKGILCRDTGGNHDKRRRNLRHINFRDCFRVTNVINVPVRLCGWRANDATSMNSTAIVTSAREIWRFSPRSPTLSAEPELPFE